MMVFFVSSRRRHTRFDCDWSSDVCSSDLVAPVQPGGEIVKQVVREVGAVAHPGEHTHFVVELNRDDVATLGIQADRKSTRLNSSHSQISYAVFCLKKKTTETPIHAPVGDG